MEEFDLYKGLHLTQKSCCKDRCRANYHRLAHRYHPKYGRKPSEELFNKVTLAYNVLRDEERREIYDTHGFSAKELAEKAASLAFPTPPASVLVSNEIFSHKEGDIFAKIKGQVCAEQ
eukprot:CAMPEP_0203745420 /NCGR_PEP_ID=MMETSP0098-20131031/1166_1 /ASSEMBLY_ACC=CAM_ASM_000208 /TAXON_ID=96639 /ORGANISM=" , Strain NY0313808BC1" /LENGTH=117 /DNA_ID=CAMNT_0050633193 /DNA_START=240 /DNA_END=593 /DNA_ORIENTATION=-